LSLVFGRKTNREIAEVLGLTVRTVECHRLKLMSKLDATNLAELTTRARLRAWGCA
jgi:DNA-binding NarL/FixJ family response regulator